jgi:hypothetical protein
LRGGSEFRDFDYTVAKSPVSDIDKLNGIEEAGGTSMSYKVCRTYNMLAGGWTPWTDGSCFVQAAVGLQKKNAHWYYVIGEGPVLSQTVEAESYSGTPLTCSELPRCP